MARTSTMQFTLLSREEAIAFLARCPKTEDSVGDRIAAGRRTMPVTTPEERAAVRAYNEQHGYDRTGRKLP
jgi:hypothetical protein